jgi:hypothetical protein
MATISKLFQTCNFDLHIVDVLRKPEENRLETGSKQRVRKRNKSILFHNFVKLDVI